MNLTPGGDWWTNWSIEPETTAPSCPENCSYVYGHCPMRRPLTLAVANLTQTSSLNQVSELYPEP